MQRRHKRHLRRLLHSLETVKCPFCCAVVATESGSSHHPINHGAAEISFSGIDRIPMAGSADALKNAGTCSCCSRSSTENTGRPYHGPSRANNFWLSRHKSARRSAPAANLGFDII